MNQSVNLKDISSLPFCFRSLSSLFFLKKKKIQLVFHTPPFLFPTAQDKHYPEVAVCGGHWNTQSRYNTPF